MKKLMQWTYFLDILGYGKEQKKINNQKKADDFMNFMKYCKERIIEEEAIHKEFDSSGEFNFYDYYEIKFVFISDSFVLTAIPKKTEFNDYDYYNYSAYAIIELTQRIWSFIQHVLNEKGLVIRGGISNKFTDIDTESSLAVGQGLIEAYKLESDYSNPRILLSKDISTDESLMKCFDELSKEGGSNFSLFLKDEDGMYYLNYLGFMLVPFRGDYEPFEELIIKFFKKLKKEIKSNLEKYQDSKDDKEIDIYNKYVWLKGYHNSTIENFKDLSFIEHCKINSDT